MPRPRFVAAIDRFAAAVALERARQVIREHTRYGFPVTRQHLAAVQAAESWYDRTTAFLIP